MKLKTLAKQFVIKGTKDPEITGLSSDSRTVCPGNLFVAKKGNVKDGADFISLALNAGAVAILIDLYDPFLKCPQIITSDLKKAEALLASRYYGTKNHGLFLVGVTGTKGKTTTSYLIKHLLDGLNKEAGLIGTVETIIKDQRYLSTMTTHDVITNHKLLKEISLRGCKSAVMEVSSHGLDQGRVDEIFFDLSVFTNLYPDHLDYHKSFEDYAAAKRKLFSKSKDAIINADSYWKNSKGFSFGIENGDIRAENIVFKNGRTEFSVNSEPFSLPLIGKYNVYNALAAISVGVFLGEKLETISKILSKFGSVPGRLQGVKNVFVDFAHTGESLENVLKTLKDVALGKVIVVFGAGGNRDPMRRVNLAKAANEFADVSIVTTDNPRKEDPQQIIDEIVANFKKMPLVEIDRRCAIEKAISIAKEEDIVLIAGRGHEKEQIFADKRIPFDDLEVVKEIIASRAPPL